MRTARAVLLYDGECGFCNRSVRFLYRRDPVGNLQYASLQSDVGRALLREHGLSEDKRDSMVLVTQGRALDQSTGVLRTVRLLRWPWSWLGALGLVVPRALRDWGYRQIARRRHDIFHGEACPIPPPDVRARFLD